MSNSTKINPNFWSGKRVLVAGHTGFKGAWLSLWLQRLGAEVIGISLPPSTTPNLYTLLDSLPECTGRFCDLRSPNELAKLVSEAKPEIVFHLAAQAVVRESYRQPLDTFSTNVMGTANMLDALRAVDQTRVVVAVTTDKVYQNREWAYPYREDDALGGHDPYSASKAAAELVISSYASSYLLMRGVAVASARAGNVIGGGDWAPDRLIPDAVRAWGAGLPLEIRRPDAIRPWQHVLEPCAAYLMMAQKLWENPTLAGSYNFGPETGDTATVLDVAQVALAAYGRGEVNLGQVDRGPHEAGSLSLEVSKAKSLLGILPKWRLHEAIQRTMSWYRGQEQGASALELCLADITAYEAFI